MKFNAIVVALLALAMAGCAQIRPLPAAPPAGHLRPAAVPVASTIPAVIAQVPYVPTPDATPAQERYTVVVNDVPVRELLFALARDAKLNIDIGGEIAGNVTLNAIDQTLPQILERVARQVSLRYEVTRDTIVISPDDPYLRTYDVGYVNLARDMDTTVNVATRVATTGNNVVQGGSGGNSGNGGGGENNSSSTRLETRSYNRFWDTLRSNILSILEQANTLGGDAQASDKVIVNAETGLITVRATSRQHKTVEEFIDRVLVNARRQVMIEATIVEVSLNDQYQSGVDWDLLLRQNKSGFTVDQSVLGKVADGAIDNAISSFTFGFQDFNLGNNQITATVRLLHEFGDTKVLSSPRLMAMNNQTAVLKVVEELVYFTLNVTNRDSSLTSQARTLVETEVHSVPVGLVMAVTPQVSANNEVTLTVRPTISQKIGDAVDPGPGLVSELRGGSSNVTNLVPVIRVREMESVLKLTDGQIGVLGGLMQDDIRRGYRDVPGLSKLPIIGDMFFRTEETNNRKTELVVFLRPVVVRSPNIDTDLKDYRGKLGSITPVTVPVAAPAAP